MTEEKQKIVLGKSEEDTYEREKKFTKKPIPPKATPKPQNPVICKIKRRHKARSNP